MDCLTQCLDSVLLLIIIGDPFCREVRLFEASCPKEGPDTTRLEFCLRVHRSFHYDRFEWIALRLTGHQSLFYWFIATTRVEGFPTSISLSTRLTEGSSDQPPPKARYVEK